MLQASWDACPPKRGSLSAQVQDGSEPQPRIAGNGQVKGRGELANALRRPAVRHLRSTATSLGSTEIISTARTECIDCALRKPAFASPLAAVAQSGQHFSWSLPML